MLLQDNQVRKLSHSSKLCVSAQGITHHQSLSVYSSTLLVHLYAKKVYQTGMMWDISLLFGNCVKTELWKNNSLKQ